MSKTKEVIGFKEIVIVVLFSILTFAVSMLTAMPFAASVYGQLYGGYALMAVLSGPIYVLMISKAPKIGTQILFFAVKGLYMLLMGQVLVGVIFILGGCVCEIICLNGGYKNPIRNGAAYALHTTVYGLGSFFPMLFFADNYKQQLISAGYDEAAVEKMLAIYHDPLIICSVAGVLIVSSCLGFWLGTKMLKKHFKPAGVAD